MALNKHQNKGMLALITEIAMKATVTACEGIHPSRVEAVAFPLAQALADIVVLQGNEPEGKKYTVDAPNFVVWEMWNRILDEIEKEIPCANKIEVVTKALRTDRKDFTSGLWRNNIKKPLVQRGINDATTPDGYRGGETQGLA